jgi:hypothetical protein
MAAVAQGDIVPGEGQALTTMLGASRQGLEFADIEAGCGLGRKRQMRSVETRVQRLEAELGDKPSAVQFLIVPREVPWQKGDKYIRAHADRRRLLVFSEGLPLAECMAHYGVVESMRWRFIMGIKERSRRLEEGQDDDFQRTLDVLTLMHKIEPGHPPSAGSRRELERQARELVARGVVYSLAEILKKVDGKGLPLPGGTR